MFKTDTLKKFMREKTMVDTILDKLKELTNLKSVGFTMDEVMDGEHHFINGAGPQGEFPFSFQLNWGTENVEEFFDFSDKDSFMVANCTGTINVGGLEENVPCQGTLALKYISDQKLIYTLFFRTSNGKEYKYVGEKINLRPWNLHKTHTTCYGTIWEKDSNKEISKSTVHFRMNTIVDFVSSFRLNTQKEE